MWFMCKGMFWEERRLVLEGGGGWKWNLTTPCTSSLSQNAPLHIQYPLTQPPPTPNGRCWLPHKGQSWHLGPPLEIWGNRPGAHSNVPLPSKLVEPGGKLFLALGSRTLGWFAQWIAQDHTAFLCNSHAFQVQCHLNGLKSCQTAPRVIRHTGTGSHGTTVPYDPVQVNTLHL